MMDHLVLAATVSDGLVLGIILLVLAAGLIASELVIPSGGLLTIGGVAAAIAAVVVLWNEDTTLGLSAAALVLFGFPIGGYLLFNWFITTKSGGRFVLGGSEDGRGTDDVQAKEAEAARQAKHHALKDMIGQQGLTVTELRPVGRIEVNGERHEAISESGIIDAGTPIEIVNAYDAQLKVRPVPSGKEKAS